MNSSTTEQTKKLVSGCPENFRESLSTPTATFPEVLMDWAYECAYKIRSLYSFIRSWDNMGYRKNWAVPGYAHASFLPRDASAESGYEIAFVCLSVCLSVTFRYRVQIHWNCSKIISRPNSLRPMCWLTPNIGDLVQREHPQNWGWIGVG